MRVGKFIFVLIAVACVAQSASAVSAIPDIELHGEFVSGGVECPLFRVDDGRVFALEGIDRGLAQIGKKARLWGQESMFSTCQQGPAFGVARAEIDVP